MSEHDPSTNDLGTQSASGEIEIEVEASRPAGAGDDASTTRRRLVTGVLAAMLVAGAGGVGFGLGRAVSDDAPSAASVESVPTTVPADEPDSPAAPTTPSTTEADTAVPTVPADDMAEEPGATVGTSPPLDASEVVADEGVDGDIYVDPYQQPMTTVYERELPDGTRVRLQRSESNPEGWYYDPTSDWTPASWCYPSATGRVTLDGPDIVDAGYASIYDETFRDVQAEQSELGYADGHPIRVLVVHAPAAATNATVAWDDGGSDSAAVIGGHAVLVVPGSNSWEVDFTVTVDGPDGASSYTRTDFEYWNDPDYRAGCQEPPPALPDAGEQPADPDAERAALAAAFDRLWDTDVPRDDKLDVLDDWTGIDEALEQVNENYGDTAATAVHEMGEIVFTGPTEAWFFYSVLTDISDFYDRYGYATLVDGQWQFPRALMCQDLGLGGGQCEPPTQPIYSPAWYERYDGELGAAVD